MCRYRYMCMQIDLHVHVFTYTHVHVRSAGTCTHMYYKSAKECCLCARSQALHVVLAHVSYLIYCTCNAHACACMWCVSSDTGWKNKRQGKRIHNYKTSEWCARSTMSILALMLPLSGRQVYLIFVLLGTFALKFEDFYFFMTFVWRVLPANVSPAIFGEKSFSDFCRRPWRGNTAF